MKNRICKNFISVAVIALFLTAFGTVNAEAATYDKNIADGSITIKDSDSYVILGTTEEHHITVEKGNPTITIKELTIDLCNEKDDDKSVEASPISVKGDVMLR